MKKLMFVALAALATAAFADEFTHKDLTANVEGYYDVTLTTKRLAHAEKTVSKSFTTSENKGTAYQQFIDHMAVVTNYAGFTVIGGAVAVEEDAKKIAIKYSYYDFDKDGNYKTKIVSSSSKGLYDSAKGQVYLWDTAEKVEVQYDKDNRDIIVPSDKNNKGIEKIQKGYKAYQVPLAMHNKFIATDDSKAAGGFIGGCWKAADGTMLDFSGLKAFGTGTFDSKNDYLKTVSGNVASMSDDVKYGCYGTWKLNKDTKDYGNLALEGVLLKKGCVELVNEAAVQ